MRPLSCGRSTRSPPLPPAPARTSCARYPAGEARGRTPFPQHRRAHHALVILREKRGVATPPPTPARTSYARNPAEEAWGRNPSPNTGAHIMRPLSCGKSTGSQPLPQHRRASHAPVILREKRGPQPFPQHRRARHGPVILREKCGTAPPPPAPARTSCARYPAEEARGRTPSPSTGAHIMRPLSACCRGAPAPNSRAWRACAASRRNRTGPGCCKRPAGDPSGSGKKQYL